MCKLLKVKNLQRWMFFSICIRRYWWWTWAKKMFLSILGKVCFLLLRQVQGIHRIHELTKKFSPPQKLELAGCRYPLSYEELSNKKKKIRSSPVLSSVECWLSWPFSNWFSSAFLETPGTSDEFQIALAVSHYGIPCRIRFFGLPPFTAFSYPAPGNSSTIHSTNFRRTSSCSSCRRLCLFPHFLLRPSFFPDHI